MQGGKLSKKKVQEYKICIIVGNEFPGWKVQRLNIVDEKDLCQGQNYKISESKG